MEAVENEQKEGVNNERDALFGQILGFGIVSLKLT